MILWPFIILLSAISFVALILSGRKRDSTSVTNNDLEKTESHFKLQLAGIDADWHSGRLAPQEAEAAKVELARELVRHREALSQAKKSSDKNWMSTLLLGTTALIIISAVGIYWQIGTPDQSVLVRTQIRAADVGAPAQNQEDFARLLEQVEAQMLVNPDDINGWRVLGPAYIRAARYEDAVKAYTHILNLAPPSADALTDLAEALLLANGSDGTDEVMALLSDAAQLDPTHARSRFYLAAESTRLEKWDEAIVLWKDLLELATGQEPWLASAQNGLEIASARGEIPVSQDPAKNSTQADAEQIELIRSMVEGLDARLNEEGGTIEEWTRLVQSYIVMGQTQKAQLIYQKAVQAYPIAAERTQLDALASQANLNISSQ